MTPFTKELEIPTPPTPPSVVIDDNTPLNSVGMPFYTERLFSSSWPAKSVFNSGKIPTPIDPEILSSMKMIDFVGYAPNPGTKLRNQVSVSTKHASAGSSSGPKFRSEQAKELYYGRYKEEEVEGEEPSPISPTGMEMPKYQRRVEIKYSKFGVEDFDFGYYNKTAFGGLETHITNSYCNSLLQVLFFVPALRMIAKSHIGLPCPKEFCMTCELGFLFRMLEDADGQNCQATNFLRAFGTIPQAAALGLFEPEQPNEKTSYGLLIQFLNRFIFEQIHQECNAPDGNPELVLGAREDVPCPSVIQQVFGLKMASQSKCTCGALVTRTTYPFVVDLLNAKKSSNQGRDDSNAHNRRRRFEDILQSSIRRDTLTKAWCSKCSQYQMTKQTKSLQGFPFVLAVNTSASVMEDLERWSTVEADEDNKPWLPPRIGIVKDGDSYIIIPESRVEGEGDKDVVIYELTAVLSQVQADKEIPHLIAHVKIPNSDVHKLDSKLKTRGRWCLFNDFLVKHVSESEVFQPRGTWKVPAIMHYARVDMDDMIVGDVLTSTVDQSILYEDFSIAKYRNKIPRSFTPLTPEEGPKPGFFCAIDAEFIALNQEETEIRSDGTRSMLRPSRHSLARVSVLRGEGPLEGVPFIDDYIATSEPIVDYLTEFSGIEAADLDPAVTKHTLVPLKVAYKKLRLLVDMGVVFVGHGLVKDFRIINILVPPEQVIDTVNIWHIPNKQRKISLRFLAWYLLKQDIQKDSHDSIEDARTALLLYKKYVELQKEGKFGQVLEELYVEGRNCNWKPWGSPVAASAVTGSPDGGGGGGSSYVGAI